MCRYHTDRQISVTTLQVYRGQWLVLGSDNVCTYGHAVPESSVNAIIHFSVCIPETLTQYGRSLHGICDRLYMSVYQTLLSGRFTSIIIVISIMTTQWRLRYNEVARNVINHLYCIINNSQIRHLIDKWESYTTASSVMVCIGLGYRWCMPGMLESILPKLLLVCSQSFKKIFPTGLYIIMMV